MSEHEPKPKSPQLKSHIVKRNARRDERWPDAGDVVYSPAVGGYFRPPRTLPLLAALIDHLGGKQNAGRLYVVLWSYDFGDGYIEVPDPVELALEAGYATPRAERSFEERIETLRSLEFVRTAPLGLRKHGFVLLVDPHRVVATIRAERPEAIPAAWWSVYAVRCTLAGIPQARSLRT